MYHILIVDDNPAITDILARIIRHEGLKATGAHSGEEVLALLEKEHPDLILLDILMEPLDGWETLHRIKKNPKTRDIPVMMITGKPLDPAEVQAHSAQFEDYIQKPITRRNLCRVIREFFRKETDIEDEVQKARLGGVKEKVIKEFRILSREIEVHQRLLLLLWNVYRTAADDDPRKEELLDAIGHLEAAQNTLRERIQEIRKDIPGPGKKKSAVRNTGDTQR